MIRYNYKGNLLLYKESKLPDGYKTSVNRLSSISSGLWTKSTVLTTVRCETFVNSILNNVLLKDLYGPVFVLLDTTEPVSSLTPNSKTSLFSTLTPFKGFTSSELTKQMWLFPPRTRTRNNIGTGLYPGSFLFPYTPYFSLVTIS